MYARITKFKMKTSSVDAAKAKLEELKPKIMALPGMHQFVDTMADDGSGYVVAIVESRETSEANTQHVAALWANFSEYLEDKPEAEGYDVIANWHK